MFERPDRGERAVLVHVALGADAGEECRREFKELALSAGADPVALISALRRAPDPRLFVGSGKAEEIRETAQAHGAELVILDQELSPSQERNLERVLQCRVLDRTGLILDIFAQRARSFEGKLQVELAQLRHLSTRLVRGWTHLERQKGGIGLRGPGETQLETDRRLLGVRIDQIRRRLARVDSRREQGRRARRRAEVPTVSLVGYTNAGKSTLFNRLTDAGVYAQDQLFATLDPTLRRLPLAEGEGVVLADTVGFVSRLPHELVAAFRSTLQETSQAALLLHVVDASSPERDAQRAEVNRVLSEIGAGELPCIEVFNKLDRLEDTPARLDRNTDGCAQRVWLSAQTGEGITLLMAALQEFFRREHVHRVVHLGPDEGRLRALLFERGQVLAERADEAGGCELEVSLTRRDFEQLLRREPELQQHLDSGDATTDVPGKLRQDECDLIESVEQRSRKA
jgi:GTP-binding protein HflX